MQAKDLALALNVITKAYPDAEVVPGEHDVNDEKFILIQLPNQRSMRMNLKLEVILEHLDFKYSDAHGACWYARL